MENMLKTKQKFVWPIITIVAVVLAGYFYYQLHVMQQNPQAIAQKEATELIAKVSRLIVLPAGETPTIATISDPALLTGQQFFASAKKGDKVLIYTQAKKAILYSTLMDKIIDVAPLNIGTQAAVTPPTTTTTPAPTTKK